LTFIDIHRRLKNRFMCCRRKAAAICGLISMTGHSHPDNPGGSVSPAGVFG